MDFFRRAFSVAGNMFAWAAEQGFVGVAAYIACWVFMFPVMIAICIVGAIASYLSENFDPKKEIDEKAALYIRDNQPRNATEAEEFKEWDRDYEIAKRDLLSRIASDDDDVIDNFEDEPDAFKRAIAAFKEEEEILADFDAMVAESEDDAARLSRVSAELNAIANRLEEKLETGLTITRGSIRYPIERKDGEGQPDLFMRGNHEYIKETDGYKRLLKVCEPRGLEVRLETDFGEQLERQMEMDWTPSLAPTPYHVKVVIARPDIRNGEAISGFETPERGVALRD